METQNDGTVTENTDPRNTSMGGDANVQTDVQNTPIDPTETKLADATRRIQELEEKIARQAPTSDIVRAIESAVRPQERQVSEDERLADMVITNPAEFVKTIEERLERKMTKAKQEEGIQSEFWNSFYKEHPHLNNHRSLVNNVMNANLLKLKDLPADKAAQMIATEATGIYKSILGENGSSEAMPRGNTGILPSSTSAMNNTSRKKESGITSFADEIKTFQKKEK